jgi:hypothetical protein
MKENNKIIFWLDGLKRLFKAVKKLRNGHTKNKNKSFLNLFFSTKFISY